MALARCMRSVISSSEDAAMIRRMPGSNRRTPSIKPPSTACRSQEEFGSVLFMISQPCEIASMRNIRLITIDFRMGTTYMKQPLRSTVFPFFQ